VTYSGATRIDLARSTEPDRSSADKRRRFDARTTLQAVARERAARK
jgi:hypothetical protein